VGFIFFPFETSAVSVLEIARWKRNERGFVTARLARRKTTQRTCDRKTVFRAANGYNIVTSRYSSRDFSSGIRSLDGTIRVERLARDYRAPSLLIFTAPA